ncbi:C45 family autoproteolytic acyltransferase/hydolase [Flavobacterium oreochromis]|uniref:Peptidase C45 hydrolase domain-containing protein n=2 Tax=Flavobacterium TaxID=237 RepID=A0A246G8B7_9FLAO|nr:C45 family peptidase [Flavobacterium oreochromis]OWP75086.1 hypothetical protein BWK62_12775 [Flavobacterium oreochromis]OWP76206.1 hypothetical protein BWG23_08750 [Flavobacterium oreochromis]POR24067.1 hypothetical protein BWK58_08815 [Flavobacterium columnare]QYS86475.1 hypothetical protein JJC03_16550 [Flavobacterium oreochromis]
MKEIQLSGTYYEMGKQHGSFLKEDIHRFLEDGYFQINRLCNKPINGKNVKAYTEVYQQSIQRYLPEIYEEIKGLSEGAGITLEDAILLQIRREIIGSNAFTLAGDCSSIGIHRPNNLLAGQTIDLNGDMTSLGQVFKLKPFGKDKPEILQYSFSGLLGYMGMNNFGLSVCINLVVSNGWQAGIPPYLLVRKFLECKQIDECLDCIKSLPIASSRSFIIQDKHKQIILEITPSKYRVIESDILLHTNHYLHEDLQKDDVVNIFSKNSSRKRLEVLQAQIAEKQELEDIKTMFRDHSVYPVGTCAHNESNFNWSETVAAVIMQPKEGIFHALKGKPCKENYSVFKF